jgi:hypothetical protein
VADRLDAPEWHQPARLVRVGIGVPGRVEIAGRWTDLVVTLRGPAAWNAAHTLTIASRTGDVDAPALVLSLDALDWQPVAGDVYEATVSIANRPGDGFALELERDGADPGTGTVILDARGPEAGGGGSLTGEKVGELVTPRALPQIAVVLHGLDTTTGKLRPIQVDTTGALTA